jgi:hypothetical protein
MQYKKLANVVWRDNFRAGSILFNSQKNKPKLHVLLSKPNGYYMYHLL